MLVTGAPGVGKTTVIQRVATRLAGKRLSGFFTEEIRKHGKREGFRFVTFNGLNQVIAHVDFSKKHCVGKYGVDVTALDSVVGPSLRIEPDVDVYLIDEIGKMECLSDRFVSAMRILLDSQKAVIATIALRGSGFIAEVKRRKDCVLYEVTRPNRNELPARILAHVCSECGPKTSDETT